MANFNTHFAIGALVTGAAASICYVSHLSSLQLSMSLWVIGVVGGLLPDIDSDNSTILKILFNGLAFLGIGVGAYWLAPHLKLWQLWAALAGIFLVIRYPIKIAFQKFSRHRGVFHSLLAVVFFAVLSSWFNYRVMLLSVTTCWLIAAFISMGYLVHLVLDELYSVDIANNVIKRSFGTALKPFSLNNYWRSFFMALGVGFCIWQGPAFYEPVKVIAGKLSYYFQWV